MPSQDILKIRDGTPLEAEEILTYIKKPRNGWKRVARILCPRNGSVWHFSSKLDVPSNVLQKKRVARILVFKIRPSQEILKIRDGTPSEAEEILTYRKSPKNGSVWYFSSKFDVHSNVLQKKRGTDSVFKIRPSQDILKIRDGTPLEAEEILTYIKKPRNGWVWHFSSKLDVPSNVLQKKRVARILVFKIRPSQEILKNLVLDVPSNVLQKKRVARILVFKIRPSQEILKIRDGTPSEAEEILTYRKSPKNGSVWYFSSKFDVHSNVLQKKRGTDSVFKIRPSQDILKIRDDVPSNVLQKKRVARILVFKIRPSQEILKIRDDEKKKSPRNGSVWHFSSKLDVPSNVLQKKRVARILVFKIRPAQEILKIRDGTHSEAKEILIYRKSPRNGSVWHFSSKLDVPSNVLHKKRVARILVFKIRPSQEILKIRDGTPSEAEEILTYRKKPRNGSISHFSSKSDVPNNVLQNKRVARILVFTIRPSQEILKIRDGTLSELDVPSNVLQKKRVARILVFKIRPSQEILKIRDGTHSEAKEILIYRKALEMGRVARILVFKIRPSQEILKIRDGTHSEAKEILIYRKSPRNGSVWHFSSKLDVPSNVLHKKRVARILVFKIRSSQEILKFRDGTPSEAEEILTYRKKDRNGSISHFSSKSDVPSNVLQKKRVARILVFKIRPSQEILKIRDGTPSEAEEILTYRKNP
ncbi:hypothetical protein OROMI_012947 [Orobanche minor]